MDFGSQPNDGGFISDLSAEDVEYIAKNNPGAEKFIRKLYGARELLHNVDRYCVWVEDYEVPEANSFPLLAKRFAEVQKVRLESKRPVTRELAKTPYKFGFISQPKTRYIAVPRVSSENRDYVPMAVMEPEVITNDALLVVPMKSMATFAFLQSKVFNVWNKAVSGRLKSDTRISGTITYNTFVAPNLDDNSRDVLERAADGVLVARASFAYNSLADLYGQTSMPQALRRAHESLDQAVLRVFGLRPNATDDEILAELFKRYEAATLGQ
jgi:hypothetical protein